MLVALQRWVEVVSAVRKAMEFYPARPGLRDVVPVAFLLLLLVILIARIIARDAPWPLVGLTCTALLIVGGVWLQLRHRFPGRPALRVDRVGMTYRRGSREQSLKWSEVSGISVDFTLNQMKFISTSGAKPIVMHRNMIAADGQQWLMLMDDYWKAPKEKGRRRSAC